MLCPRPVDIMKYGERGVWDWIRDWRVIHSSEDSSTLLSLQLNILQLTVWFYTANGKHEILCINYKKKWQVSEDITLTKIISCSASKNVC